MVAGKLLISSIREMRKRKKIDSKKTNHFVLIEFSMKKYNETDMIIAGIRIMPAPLGIDFSWLPLLEGWSKIEFFFRKGMIFFNAEKQKKYNMNGMTILTITWIQ